VPEVLVAGRRFAVVRRRPSFDEMLALESTPDWLAAALPDRAEAEEGAEIAENAIGDAA
jgi:hypothetical protein